MRANTLVSSGGWSALEDLQVRNQHLATAVSYVGWACFWHWAEPPGRVQQVPVIAVPEQYTTQACSGCGKLVRASLSIRIQVYGHCGHCRLVLDRDHNAVVIR